MWFPKGCTHDEYRAAASIELEHGSMRFAVVVVASPSVFLQLLVLRCDSQRRLPGRSFLGDWHTSAWGSSSRATRQRGRFPRVIKAQGRVGPFRANTQCGWRRRRGRCGRPLRGLGHNLCSPADREHMRSNCHHLPVPGVPHSLSFQTCLLQNRVQYLPRDIGSHAVSRDRNYTGLYRMGVMPVRPACASEPPSILLNNFNHVPIFHPTHPFALVKCAWVVPTQEA